jgi:hypothetical protein
LDHDGGEDWCPSASSPSRSLPEVRYLRVMAFANVRSLICLHGVKVFDQVERPTHGTAGSYGRAVAVPVVAKAFVA